MDQCGELEIARLLGCVSEQRRLQALSYKHKFGQFCCLKSYEMLVQLLQKYSSNISSEVHLNTFPSFQYNEYGQPSLLEGPYFSISHCKSAVAVVVSETHVGIDIESIRNVKQDLITKTMNEKEKSFILNAQNPELEFTKFWTKKEAYLKLKGTGINENLKNTLVSCENIEWLTKVNVEKNYVMTIAISAEQSL